MKRKSSLYIKDMIDAIVKIQEFIKDMSFDQFVQDDKTSSAVVRKLEIIGKTVKQIPDEITNKYREIPWFKIVGLRNRLAHGYFLID